jgi:hypothetical protein
MASQKVKDKIKAINEKKRAQRALPRKRGETVQQTAARHKATTGDLSIQVKQPERDEQGMTAIGRQVEANKAKQAQNFTAAPQDQLNQVSSLDNPTQAATAPEATGSQLPFETISRLEGTDVKPDTLAYLRDLERFGKLSPVERFGELMTGGELPTPPGTVAGVAPAASFTPAGKPPSRSTLSKLEQIAKGADDLLATQPGKPPNLKELGKGFNVKDTVKQATSIKKLLGKLWSKKAQIFYGSWIGSVALGQWAKGEAAEQFTIFRDNTLIPDAMNTGDWTLVNEANEAADEVITGDWLQQIGLWSPLGGIVGSAIKANSFVQGQLIRKKYQADMEERQNNGETETDYWNRIREEQAEQDRAAIDYYNEERKKLLTWEREAEQAARTEDAAFWKKQREEEYKSEEKERKAIADFWQAYREYNQKIQQNLKPSNLNFGLL